LGKTFFEIFLAWKQLLRTFAEKLIKNTAIMTAIQLNVALHREMSYIVTDSTMMERALKSLRKIRREWKAEQIAQCDSPEQVKESLSEGFKGLKLLKEGKLQAKPIKELLDELRD
jgi:hypothetical protein